MHRALVPMALATALAACADNGDEAIFVTKNVAPGDTCTFTASESEPFLPHGTWSVFSPGSYLINPQMKSRVTAAAGQEQQRTIILQGARVDLAFADPSLFDAAELTQLASQGVTKFETRFSAPLSPNGGVTDAGFDLIPRTLIDAVLAKQPGIDGAGAPSFRTEILASFVVYGDMSGNEVTSQVFQFPVTLCNDCVVNVRGSCPLPAATTLRAGNPCNPYQDGVVDCCVEGELLVCPGTLANL